MAFYPVANLKCMELDAGATLAAKDGIHGSHPTVVQEFHPLLYNPTGTAGKIFMVVDGLGVTAAFMQTHQALGTVDGNSLVL